MHELLFQRIIKMSEVASLQIFKALLRLKSSASAREQILPPREVLCMLSLRNGSASPVMSWKAPHQRLIAIQTVADEHLSMSLSRLKRIGDRHLHAFVAVLISSSVLVRASRPSEDQPSSPGSSVLLQFSSSCALCQGTGSCSETRASAKTVQISRSLSILRWTNGYWMPG